MSRSLCWFDQSSWAQAFGERPEPAPTAAVAAEVASVLPAPTPAPTPEPTPAPTPMPELAPTPAAHGTAHFSGGEFAREELAALPRSSDDEDDGLESRDAMRSTLDASKPILASEVVPRDHKRFGAARSTSVTMTTSTLRPSLSELGLDDTVASELDGAHLDEGELGAEESLVIDDELPTSNKLDSLVSWLTRQREVEQVFIADAEGLALATHEADERYIGITSAMHLFLRVASSVVRRKDRGSLVLELDAGEFLQIMWVSAPMGRVSAGVVAKSTLAGEDVELVYDGLRQIFGVD